MLPLCRHLTILMPLHPMQNFLEWQQTKENFRKGSNIYTSTCFLKKWRKAAGFPGSTGYITHKQFRSLLEDHPTWRPKECVLFPCLQYNITSCTQMKMWKTKQHLNHHLQWMGLTPCLGLLLR